MPPPTYPRRRVIFECDLGHHHPSRDEADACHRLQWSAWSDRNFARINSHYHPDRDDGFTDAWLADPIRRAVTLHYARGIAES